MARPYLSPTYKGSGPKQSQKQPKPQSHSPLRQPQNENKGVTYWKYLDPFIEPDLERLSEADLDRRRDTDLDRRGDADLDLEIKSKFSSTPT